MRIGSRARGYVDVRYRKAWDVLRPGGHVAFWSATHVFPEDGDPFFAEIQEVYEEIGEGLPPASYADGDRLSGEYLRNVLRRR